MSKSLNVNLEYPVLKSSLLTQPVSLSVVEEAQQWLEHQDTKVSKRAFTAFRNFVLFYLGAQVLRLFLS